MVTTRGRKSVINTAAEKDSPSRSRRAKETPVQEDVDLSDQGETIGSRLRKRRFANGDRTTTSEDASPRSKRVRRSRTPADREIVEISGKSPSISHSRRTRLSQVTKAQQHLEGAAQNNDGALKDTITIVGEEQKSLSVEPNNESEIDAPAQGALDTLPLIDQFWRVLRHLPTEQLSAHDLTSVLQDIIKHGEKVDQYEKWGKNVDTDGLPTMGAELELKVKALPILANITTQLLHIFATYSYRNLVTIVAEPDSDAGKIFHTYSRLFERTKKVYATKDAFISSPEVTKDPANAAKQVRNANLSTFVVSCFGSGDVGFYHLNEYFLDIFASDGSRLLKQQASMYLELKTQAYLSAMSNHERVKSVVLDELFPDDLEQRLLNRRSGTRPLHQSESEFIERAKNRRRHLQAEPDTTTALDVLKDRYKWEAFLSDLAGYLSKNFEGLVGHTLSAVHQLCGKVVSLQPDSQADATTTVSRRSSTAPLSHSPSPVVETRPPPQSPLTQTQRFALPPPPPPPSYYHMPQPPPPVHIPAPPMVPNGFHPHGSQFGEDIAAKAARAAQEAFQGYPHNGQPIIGGRPMPPPPHHYGPNPYGPPHQPQPPLQSPSHFMPPHPSPYGPPTHHIQHPQSMAPLPLRHAAPPTYPHGPPPGPPGPPGPHQYYHYQPPHHLQHPPPQPIHGSLPATHPHAPPPYVGPRPDNGSFIHHAYPPPPGHPQYPGTYYTAARGTLPPLGYPPPNPALAPPPPSHMYSMPQGQSLPTAILYEKARAVALKATTPGKTKGSTVSHRRPWSTEEEQALMAGLDAVKGPHWSQILALYGPGGTLGEPLRDRTQVQLKDKARNLKLFFLKSRIEVPFYLGFVTGELKSRAPSHVAAEGENNASPENNDRIEPILHEFDPPSPPDKPIQSIESQPTLTPTPTSAAPTQPQGSTYASPYAAVAADQRARQAQPSVPAQNTSAQIGSNNIGPGISQAPEIPVNGTYTPSTTIREESINVAAPNGTAPRSTPQPSLNTTSVQTITTANKEPVTNGEKSREQDSAKAVSPAASISDPSAQQLQAEQGAQSERKAENIEDPNGPSAKAAWQAINA